MPPVFNRDADIASAQSGLFRRSFSLEHKALDKENRKVELAFSSDEPYERWWGIEILDHGAKSVRLGRLNDGRHPLLVNHDLNRQAGVIEKAWIDDDRKGRSKARFGKGAYASEIFEDVNDGIRSLVSVGYAIHKVIEESTEKDGTVKQRELTGDQFRALVLSEDFARAIEAKRASSEKVSTFRVIDWEPYENSIVAVPADTTVGIGRSAEPAPRIEVVQPEKTRMEKKPEELERERVSLLLTLGTQYAKYITAEDVGQAIRDGKSVADFKEVIMQKMQTAHSDTSAARIGMSAKEVQRYSLVRACVAAMSGSWAQAGLELEASKAVAKMLRQEPSGFFVPWDAFQRDFNVGTGSEAGNLVATELRPDLFVDVLRNKLVLGQLGIRILAGLTSNLDIPKKTVAGAISRVTEIQALTETNPQTGKVSLSPKRLGAYVEYSKQALIQSAMAIEPMLRDDLLQGVALDMQDQVINGSGAGANMRGIRNTSGIGSVVGGANGAAIAWSHFVDLESACANVNAEPDQVSGYLTNTKVRGATKKTQKGTNLPFIWDNGAMPLNGYRAAISNSVPSNLTKGTSTTIASSVLFGSDWSMSVLGLFGAPDIVVDPVTLATTGQVRITINQYADHGVRLPACFASMDDALTP
jgi:HK97 family phage major capsid protein